MKDSRHIGLPRLSLLRAAPLWGLAGLAAVAAHAAVGLSIVAFAPEMEMTGPAVEPLRVELAPLVVSEAESVETVETVASLEPEETEVEETPTVEEEVTEKVEEEQPEEVAELEPEVVEEELPVVRKAEAVLPKPVKKKVEKKPEKKVEKRVEPVKKPVKKADVGKHNPDAKASSTSNSKASRGAPAPSADELARWKARVQKAVTGRKPRNVSNVGNVTIVFEVNAAGAVVSVEVAKSSGYSDLDDAALSMARRAVPNPPKGTRLPAKVTMPIRFELRRR